MKRILCSILIILSLLLTGVFSIASASVTNKAVFVEGNLNYSVNGTVYQMDVAPYVEKGRFFIPATYLASAVGLEENNVMWDSKNQILEMRWAGGIIKLKANDSGLYLDNKVVRMDVAPALKDGRIFLPAKWVLEALGCAVGWDQGARALLVGPPGDLPGTGTIPLKAWPAKVRPCQLSGADLRANQLLSSSSITFESEYSNVFNAGVAAQYVNGYILEPGQVFSFNEVIGERTGQKGFITGYDILNELTVGGGVCRTSTVLYQVATGAGLEILERHPHYLPVHYTPPGTDASVSYGTMDLKFRNSLNNPLLFNAGLEEEEGGRRLWTQLWERKPLSRAELAIAKQAVNRPNDEGPKLLQEKTNVVALVRDGVSFASLEQLGDLFQFKYEIKEQEGTLAASFYLNNQSVIISEGSKKALKNGVEFELREKPFSLPGSNCRLWLPLTDWAALAGARVQWVEGPAPFILLTVN